MKLAIIFNRYHTSMLCKRAPVHLQWYATSTGTSNSKQANKHQYINARRSNLEYQYLYINARRSNLEYQYLLGTNSYFDQSQYFRTIYPNLQFCYFKFRQKTFGSVLPSLLSVGRSQSQSQLLAQPAR